MRSIGRSQSILMRADCAGLSADFVRNVKAKIGLAAAPKTADALV